MTLVYGEVLTKGYGWSQASVGLINIGIFPASIAAMVYAGWFGDKLNVYMARRNRGIHTPEHTLLVLVFPAIASLVGIVAFAAGSNWPGKVSEWAVIMGKLAESSVGSASFAKSSKQAGLYSNSASSLYL